MAPVVHASGSQTATIGTEHELVPTGVAAVPGTYILAVDLTNLAAGETVELRGYKMVLSGGTARVVYVTSIDGAAPTDDMVRVSVPISNALTTNDAVRFTLKQLNGTGRVFPYEVLRF